MSLEKRIKGLVDLDYLKINSLYSGSSVNNLGIDINGNVVVGVTGDTNFNYYVTGGTYDSNTDIITLNRNDNLNLEISGITDTFTTGGTYDNNSGLITFDKNDGTNFLVDLSSLDLNDTYITGQTFDNNTYILSTKRNDGVTINSDLSILASDVYVVSGVYDVLTGVVTYTNSSGGTFQVSGFTTGMTDSYTSAANLNGEVIEFDNNIQGNNLYNVNLSPVLSGKTNNTDFHSYTADTKVEIDSKLNINTFNVYSGDVQTQLDSKIENGINSGGGNEVFSGKFGTDLYFRTLSGGSNTTITTIDDVIRVDVNVPIDTNTFITGGTYDDSTDVITLTRNDSVTIDITGVTDTFTTGGTYDDNTSIITFEKNDSTTYDVDLTSLPATDEVTIEVNNLNEIQLKEIVEAPTGGTRTFDSFITITSGLTLNNLFTGTSVNNLGVDINGNLVIGTTGDTDTNTYVTGFTYDDINTFTISRNDSLSDLTTTISVLSGVTYYGDGSNLSGISTDNFYVTGGSFSLETLTLDRNDGNSVIVTGFTSQPDLNYGEIFVGDSGNTAQSVQMTGDVNINNLGVTTIQPNSVTYNKMQDVTQKAVLGSDVVSGGTVTEIPIVDQFLSSGLATTLLSNVSNWDINGIYTGSTISNTYQGQMYFDGNYFFIAINDNDWVRLIRG